jgi:magnesium chelatase family protein
MVKPRGLDPRRRFEDLRNQNHTLNGAVLAGLDGYVVEIQARILDVYKRPCRWRESVKISGMARGAVSEAMDRIEGAFAKLNLPKSDVEILVNLVPPDVPKDGTWLDLPLAIIMLQAAGYLPDLPDHREGDYIIFGELGIHGEVRRVPGALSLAYMAKPQQQLICPAGNEKECALILAKPGHEGCGVFPVSFLEEVIGFFAGERKLENALKNRIQFEDFIPKSLDFSRIKGQEKAKEAAILCAAGGHNLLLIGPPGEGKSLLASAMPGILPRLSNEEKVELTKIYSATGVLETDGVAVTRRPFRPVHCSASPQSLLGGGARVPRPGEVTLAHHGVLFLDEFAEFGRGAIEALRQPLESGEVTISRVGATLTFPSRFTLVAAMNPCPCGFFGTDRCRCKEADVKKYISKISGPILDRIDLQVEMTRLTSDERFADTPSQDESPRLRANIEAARQRQVVRFTGSGVSHNAAIPGGCIRDFCDFSVGGFDHYRRIVNERNISTRSSDRLAKVARTVADLVNSPQIEPKHIEKAASFVIGGLLRDQFG